MQSGTSFDRIQAKEVQGKICGKFLQNCFLIIQKPPFLRNISLSLLSARRRLLAGGEAAMLRLQLGYEHRTQRSRRQKGLVRDRGVWELPPAPPTSGYRRRSGYSAEILNVVSLACGWIGSLISMACEHWGPMVTNTLTKVDKGAAARGAEQSRAHPDEKSGFIFLGRREGSRGLFMCKQGRE